MVTANSEATFGWAVLITCVRARQPTSILCVFTASIRTRHQVAQFWNWREKREKKKHTHTEAQCNQYAGRPVSRPMILFYSSALLSCSRERYACVWKYAFEVAAKCIRAHCHWCSRPESQSMWCASAKSDFIIPILVEQTDSFFLCLLLDNKVLY